MYTCIKLLKYMLMMIIKPNMQAQYVNCQLFIFLSTRLKGIERSPIQSNILLDHIIIKGSSIESNIVECDVQYVGNQNYHVILQVNL